MSATTALRETPRLRLVRRTRLPRLLFVATVADTVRGFLLPLAAHFRKQGWRVDAMAQSIEQDRACEAAFDSVSNAKWSRNPLDPRNLLEAGRVRRAIEQGGYDLVHVHTPVASFVTRYAAEPLRRTGKLKVVYTAHGFHFHPGGSNFRNRIFETLERRAGRWTDYLVLMNREDVAAAKDKRIMAAERIRSMPGIGIDRSFYSPEQVRDEAVDAFRSEIGIAPDVPLLLMLAEFIPRKRHSDAIAAFANVQQPGKLVFAGSGPLLDPMKDLARKLGLSDRIVFLGVRGDVPVLLRAARGLVLPSEQEGLPRSILEALSMGVPAIGSRIRGTAELLEDGAGLLVDVGDIGGLSQAMEYLLASKSAAQAMGRRGQELSERYDLVNILDLHEDLYREALQL